MAASITPDPWGRETSRADHNDCMTKNSATLIGFSAIAMWSLLAALTVATGRIPAFQLAAMTFAIGACVGSADMAMGVRARRGALRQPATVLADRRSAACSAITRFIFWRCGLRRGRSRPAQLSLAVADRAVLLPAAGRDAQATSRPSVRCSGLAGTVLLWRAAMAPGFAAAYVPGLAAAFCAACFVWAGYSVMSRRCSPRCRPMRLPDFAWSTAALATLFHLVFETTVWPQSPLQWSCIVALGLGPVGAAFYAWDIGMKHGDIRLLGALSYATPLLSTGFLILAGVYGADPCAGDCRRY